jgi:hypothetical protein
VSATFVCATCGKVRRVKRSPGRPRRYCSPKCRRASTDPIASTRRIPMVCSQCGQRFEATRTDTRFCSSKCRVYSSRGVKPTVKPAGKKAPRKTVTGKTRKRSKSKAYQWIEGRTLSCQQCDWFQVFVEFSQHLKPRWESGCPFDATHELTCGPRGKVTRDIRYLDRWDWRAKLALDEMSQEAEDKGWKQPGEEWSVKKHKAAWERHHDEMQRVIDEMQRAREERDARTIRLEDNTASRDDLIANFEDCYGYYQKRLQEWESRPKAKQPESFEERFVKQLFDPDPSLPSWRVFGTDEPRIVKQRYRILATHYHPDHAGGDATKFRIVEAAYQAVADRTAGC